MRPGGAAGGRGGGSLEVDAGAGEGAGWCVGVKCMKYVRLEGGGCSIPFGVNLWLREGGMYFSLGRGMLELLVLVQAVGVWSVPGLQQGTWTQHSC